MEQNSLVIWHAQSNRVMLTVQAAALTSIKPYNEQKSSKKSHENEPHHDNQGNQLVSHMEL